MVSIFCYIVGMNYTNILLSIHPKWAELIYSGQKTVEWRKNMPIQLTVEAVTKGTVRVYMYETAPYKAVTGYFNLGGFEPVDARTLTEDHPLVKRGHVPLADLVKYQGDSKCIWAWLVDGNTKYSEAKPLFLEDFGLKRAPQSWCYSYRR